MPLKVPIPNIGSEHKTVAIVASHADRQGRICDLGIVFVSCDERGEVSNVLDSSFSRPPIDTPSNADAIQGDGSWCHRLGAVLEVVDLVVAYDAWLQRQTVEAVHPGFVDREWACARGDVPWAEIGFRSDRLVGIGAQLGLAPRGRRARDHARLLFHVLAHGAWGDGPYPLGYLLASVAAETVRIFACDPPMDRQDALLRRGYRRSSGADGCPDAPFVDVRRANVGAERSFLTREIYGSEPNLLEHTLPADQRYRRP
ncbi:MAG: hypothetical protein ACRYGP_08185 [Janthinobacterium lividum]